MPQPVMDALTAHIARYRDGAEREDLVFTNARDGHIPRGNFSRDALAPAIKRSPFQNASVARTRMAVM